jgi:glutathione S-transferase
VTYDRPVPATLLGVPASHPSLAAELMLQRKGIEYRRFDLVAGVHRLVLRALGFPEVTVPALRVQGARVQGTRRIALALDSLVPEPPLLPADPQRRAAVEAAESWGDEVLQPVPRRIVWAALKRDRSTLATYLEGAHLGIPVDLAAATAPPVVQLAARLNHATDEAVRRDLAALPGLIDHVDRLIDEGVIGGAEPNVADFQIATSVSLLLTMEDTRPYIEGRPAERLARELVSAQVGHLPRALPAAWLPPLPVAA